MDTKTQNKKKNVTSKDLDRINKDLELLTRSVRTLELTLFKFQLCIDRLEHSNMEKNLDIDELAEEPHAQHVIH